MKNLDNTPNSWMPGMRVVSNLAVIRLVGAGTAALQLLRGQLSVRFVDVGVRGTW
jgi:hypothetical protein